MLPLTTSSSTPLVMSNPIFSVHNFMMTYYKCFHVATFWGKGFFLRIPQIQLFCKKNFQWNAPSFSTISEHYILHQCILLFCLRSETFSLHHFFIMTSLIVSLLYVGLGYNMFCTYYKDYINKHVQNLRLSPCLQTDPRLWYWLSNKYRQGWGRSGVSSGLLHHFTVN